MTYASASDVAELLARELTPEEVGLVDRRLAQVERLILRKIPDLAAKIAAGDVDAEDVKDVESESVYRVVRNPEGIVSEGDGVYQYRKSDEAADNRLRLTPEEWQMLGVRPSRMFQLVPSFGGPQ